VATVCIAVLALASSSFPDVKPAALDLRWVALALLAAWPLVSGRRPQLRVPKLLAGCAAALFLLGVLSALWSLDPELTLGRAGSFAVLLWVGLVVFPIHNRSPHERLALARWLATLCVLGALTALATIVLVPDTGRTYGPLRGWLENSNTLGLWCALLAPTLLTIRSRRLAAIAAVPVLAAIVLSQSRSALLVLTFAAFLLAPHPLRRRVVFTLATAALIAAVIASPALQLLEGTALGKFGSDGGFLRALTGARNEAWAATLDLAAMAPFEGFGFGTGDRVFASAGVDKEFLSFQGANPNSAYLNMLLEQGLVGLTLLLTALVAGAKALLARGTAHDRRTFAVIAVGVVVSGLVESLFTSAGSPFSILLWAALAVAIARDPPEWTGGQPRVLLHVAAFSAVPNGARTVQTALLAEMPRAWPEAHLIASVGSPGDRIGFDGFTPAPLALTRTGAARPIDDFGRLPALVHRTRADVVIVPNESFPSRLDVPVVVIAQNLVYHSPQIRPQASGSLVSRLRSRVQFAFYRHQMPRAYARADAVVAVSTTTAAVLTANAGLEPGDTHVIREGADGLPLLPRRLATGGPRRLLVVGTSAPYKRSEVALAALAALNAETGGRGYELHLVGGEWPGHGAALDELARELGMLERYSRPGTVESAELIELYATAHALVALSSCESFGLPVAEAMRAGLPVVLADEPWSRELAADAGLYVDGDDPVSVANGIRRLEDSSEHAARADACRSAVGNLTWRATAEGIAQVAHRVLAGRALRVTGEAEATASIRMAAMATTTETSVGKGPASAEVKSRGRAFRNAAPCGAEHATAPEGSPEFYAQVERARYELEPFIPELAGFAGSRGQSVLEIGVGLGTDLLGFARAGARVTGVDLTQRAIELVGRRLALEGLSGDLSVADAEHLPFADGTFDRTYSWGVLHHTPDTARAVREAIRVTRPGGELCLMLYGRHSWLSYGLWARHALARGRPGRSLADVLSHHMESEGTKAYTVAEVRAMCEGLESLDVRHVGTPYDRRVAGPLAGLTGSRLGWFVVARGRRAEAEVPGG